MKQSKLFCLQSGSCGKIRNTMRWYKIIFKTIQSKAVTAKNRIHSTLKLYKDQLIFVFFQLVVYLFDIGSDTKQAIEFWR